MSRVFLGACFGRAIHLGHVWRYDLLGNSGPAPYVRFAATPRTFFFCVVVDTRLCNKTPNICEGWGVKHGGGRVYRQKCNDREFFVGAGWNDDARTRCKIFGQACIGAPGPWGQKCDDRRAFVPCHELEFVLRGLVYRYNFETFLFDFFLRPG